MNERCVDFVAERARKYNLDDIIKTLVDWDPVELRKRITKAYIFASNRAMHCDFMREEDIDAIEALQQIIEALENVENAKEALLVVRVK